jgi:hypothetical protein
VTTVALYCIRLNRLSHIKTKVSIPYSKLFIHCQFHSKQLSQKTCVISSFIIPDIFALLQCYSGYVRSQLPKLRVKQSQKAAWPLKTGRIPCPENSVNSYPSKMCKIPEDRRSHLHSGRNLKSHILYPFSYMYHLL